MGIILDRRLRLFSGVWLEKYRPRSLNDIVMDSKTKNKFNEFIACKDIPNILLVGTPGTGKTSMAYILLDNVIQNEADYLELNGSLFGNIETVRNTITEFIKTRSFFSKKKIVFIDESDKLTEAAQDSLRNIIEQNADHVSFILTANYLHKISEPLRSRLQTYSFRSLDENEIFDFVIGILKNEKISFKEDDVKYIVNAAKPDVRRCLNEINKAVYTSGKDRVLSIDNMSESFTSEQALIDSLVDFYNLSLNKSVTNANIKKLYECIKSDSIDYRRCLMILSDKINKVRLQTLIAHFFNTSKDCIDIKMHMMEFIGEFIMTCAGFKK